MAIFGGGGFHYIDQDPTTEGLIPNEVQPWLAVEWAWDFVGKALYYWDKDIDKWIEFKSSTVNPDRFGAVGDGITNDAVPLQLALDYISANDYTLDLDGKTYATDTSLTLVHGKIKNGSIVAIAGGAFTNGVIEIEGTGLVAVGTLANPIVKGDREINFALVPPVVEGDILTVRDTAANSWFNGFESGEFILARELVGTTLSIMGNMADDYPTATGIVSKMTYATASMENVEVKSLPALANISCVYVKFAARTYFKNLRLTDTRYAGLRLDFCHAIDISGVTAIKALIDNFTGPYDGLSYGIHIGSSQNVTVSNSELHGVRHGITFGGTGDNLVNRYIKVANCNISSHINYAASFHPNTEYCSYDNCDIQGGVTVRGDFNTVQGCRISNLIEETVFGLVQCINLSPDVKSISHRIVNNDIVLYKKDTEGAVVLSYNESVANDPFQNDGVLEFTGNNIKIYQTGVPPAGFDFYFGMNFRNNRGNSKVIFKDNIITSDDPTLKFLYRWFSGVNPILHFQNNISNLTALKYSLTGIDYKDVIENDQRSKSNHSIKRLTTGTTNMIDMDYFFELDANTANVTLRLLDPSEFLDGTVACEFMSINNAVNTVTITSVAGNVNGVASYILAVGEKGRVVANGGNWFIF